ANKWIKTFLFVWGRKTRTKQSGMTRLAQSAELTLKSYAGYYPSLALQIQGSRILKYFNLYGFRHYCNSRWTGAGFGGRRSQHTDLPNFNLRARRIRETQRFRVRAHLEPHAAGARAQSGRSGRREVRLRLRFRNGCD